MRLVLLTVVAASLLPSLAAASPSISMPAVNGPSHSGAEKIQAELSAALREEGLAVVSDRGSVKAARQAGADLLLVVTTKKIGKGFSVEGVLTDVASGRAVKTVHRSFKKGGAKAAGESLGRELVKAAASFQAPDDQDDREEAAPVRAAPSSGGRRNNDRVVRAKDESEDERSGEEPDGADEARGSSVVPKDEDDEAGVSATLGRDASGKAAPEARMFRVGLALGSQLGTAYTVAVGDQTTKLAYNLNPLFAIAGQGRVMFPSIGLGFELGIAYVPVTYQMKVPDVTPASPGGRFLDVEALALYEITVGHPGSGEDSRVYLAPLLGLSLSSLSVDRQTRNIVVSSSAFAPTLGGRVGAQFGRFALDGTLKLNIITSYSESPDTTGNNGGGIGFGLLGSGRYWMSDYFGVQAGLGYDYLKVGFSGAGTRVGFDNDPSLNLKNASVFSGNLKATVGLVVAI